MIIIHIMFFLHDINQFKWETLHYLLLTFPNKILTMENITGRFVLRVSIICRFLMEQKKAFKIS